MSYRIDVYKRYTSKAAHYRDEFIQIIGSKPGNASAKHDNKEAKDVLLPLDVGIVFAALGEELILRNPYCRKNL
jgi:hypothetical protein